MKYLRSFSIGLIALLLFLPIAAASQAAAQDSSRGLERERLAAVMNPGSNVEDFRTEMFNYLTELENALQQFEQIPAVSRQFANDGLDHTAALRRAKEALAELSHDDLVKIRAIYAKFPGWRESPRAISGIVQKVSNGKRSVAAKFGDGPAPNVITPDACPDLSGTPSFADIAITDGFLIAADAAMEAFPTDGLTILARLIPIAARTALKVTLLTETTLRSQYDDCHGLGASDIQTIVDGAKTDIINNAGANTTTILNNATANTTSLTTAITNAKTDVVNNATTNTTTLTTAITNAKTEIVNNDNSNATTLSTAVSNAQTAIVNNDNSNRTLIISNDNSNATTLNTNLTNAKNTIVANDNTNTTNIINNDNSNKASIIANSNGNAVGLNDLILRSQIEADLGMESSSIKVAWYMTPTANGGHLDLVKTIVTQTLANILAAGGSINDAQMYLNLANANKAAGNFKLAYDNYRKAYKQAIK